MLVQCYERLRIVGGVCGRREAALPAVCGAEGIYAFSAAAAATPAAAATVRPGPRFTGSR